VLRKVMFLAGSQVYMGVLKEGNGGIFTGPLALYCPGYRDCDCRAFAETKRQKQRGEVMPMVSANIDSGVKQ
jgi:hypothetical protein